MFENKECSNGTEQGCSLESGTGVNDEEQDEWLEETVWQGMRMWHVIFMSIGAGLSVIILLCCCFKFRIPRTKQEIEGDYIRRKIMRKFRKRLKAIQNQELDEMDLKKALDKIRTELKSDTESLQQSDVLSGATLSSAGGVNPAAGSTYRRASQIQIDISLEDLRIQSLGLGARIALAFTKFFAPKKAQAGESDEENGGNGMGDVGTDKPTAALLPPKKQGTAAASKSVEGEDANKKKKDKDEQKGKDGIDSKVVDATATTSKEKAASSSTGKGKEKNKKDSKMKDSTDAAPLPTTVVTTEKETGSSDKNQDKKNNKGKKEKEPNNKSKTGGTAPPPANKEATDKGQKTTTDKKSNESQQPKK